MSNATELAELQTRLTDIRTAIKATLDRGVSNYSDGIVNLAALGVEELERMEARALARIARLQRGKFFSGIAFKRPT